MHRGAFFAAIAFLGALVLFTFAASPFLDLSPVANAQGQNSDINEEIGVVVYPGHGEVKLTWKRSGNPDWGGAQEFGYQYKEVRSGQSSNWSSDELNKEDKTLILPSEIDTDDVPGYRSYSVTNLTNGQLYSFVIRKKIGGDNANPEYGPPSLPRPHHTRSTRGHNRSWGHARSLPGDPRLDAPRTKRGNARKVSVRRRPRVSGRVILNGRISPQ